MKERIGDALRNAAMRFGAALDLWHKGDLHVDGDTASDTGRGPISPDPIRESWVKRAVDVYREELKADKDLPDYKKMQDVNAKLTPDEQMAVQDAFGKELVPGSKRMFKTVIRDYLDMKEADLINPEDYQPPLDAV